MVDALRYLLPHRDRIIHHSWNRPFKLFRIRCGIRYRTSARKVAFPEERNLLDEFYYRQDYFHNIADIYSASTLIVCRSGAGSLNEICRIGKPALLIPKANLPGDHQVMNARAMKTAGAAEVLFEDTVMEDGEILEKLEGKVLAEKIIGSAGQSGATPRDVRKERPVSQAQGDPADCKRDFWRIALQ